MQERWTTIFPVRQACGFTLWVGFSTHSRSTRSLRVADGSSSQFSLSVVVFTKENRRLLILTIQLSNLYIIANQCKKTKLSLTKRGLASKTICLLSAIL